MSFIVAGDIHLSEFTFKTCPDVKYDSVHSLEIIFRCAKNRFKEPWIFFMAPDFDPELFAALRARTDCHFILKKTKNGISEALESESVTYSASNIKELTDLVINNINTTESVRQIIRSMLANDKEFFENLPKIPN